MEGFSEVFTKLYRWRLKNVASSNFILLLSILTGLAGGISAVLLKSLVHGIQHLLLGNAEVNAANPVYFILPLIGILLTVAFRVFLNKNKLGRGIPNLLLIINKKSSLVPRDEMYSHIATSGLTVGFGGSAGLEAPSVTTGAAIGSNLGRLFHVGYKKRTLLMGCGTAAALGGIFGAPIAGVIFTLEVLLLELTIPAFIPLLIAAVTGTLVSMAVYGNDIIFNFTLTESFHYTETPFYILLGIFCGLSSYYFHKSMLLSKRLVERIEHQWKRAVLGGLVLGGMIFLLPPLFGEGYATVNQLLAQEPGELLNKSLFFKEYTNEWFLLIMVFCLLLIKVFATGITVAAGGNGGIFAPSMFTGALAGFGVSNLINKLGAITGFETNLSEKNFVMVGMAGVVSGLMHAPLTAIFLIAEVTGGYGLIVPLMIVAALSFATTRYFEKHSHYHFEMARKGQLHFHDKDKTVLSIMKVTKLIETDFVQVQVDGKLKDVVVALSASKRNIFPIVDPTGIFAGVVTLDDIRDIMFDPNKQENTLITDIMHRPGVWAEPCDSMEEVMKKFDQSGYWNLAVLDEGKYIGFLSKSKIFNHYRSLLLKESREDSEIID
ncbi:MAG: chloride channel protein [Bacteroidetes bacterium]|nr:chloride channel protein [Bacteroidota bacterium]